MTKIKQILEHYGFKGLETEKNYKRIYELKTEQLGELIINLFEAVKIDISTNNGLFEFETGRTMSGGGVPCSSFACRKEQLKKTIGFAALYSDNTCIKSPLDGHIFNLYEFGMIQPEELLFDIESLIMMEPLLKKNIITFYSEYSCLCEHCLEISKSKEQLIGDMILDKEHSINDMIKSELKFSLEYLGNEYYVKILPNLKYGFEHEMHTVIKDASIFSDIFRKIELEQIKEQNFGELSSLQKDFIFNNIIIPVYINPIISDIFYSKIFFEGKSKTYLSNRMLDGEIINKLSQKERKTSNVADYQFMDKIEYSFPYVEVRDYKKLLSMREDELSSFKVFRNELSRDIKKFDITKETYEDFQRDIIQPKLDKVNASIEQNSKFIKRNRIKNIATNIGMPAIIFAIGKYNNLDNLLVGGLSGSIPVANFVNKVFDTGSKYKVENEDYYFLWRVERQFGGK